MRKITQFKTKQDYFLDNNGFLHGRDGLMKSNTILTVNGPVTRTKDKWYCIVYLGAPADGKFYTKRKNGNLEWTIKADKTFLNLNSYVPEIDDNRVTFIYFLCDSRDGLPRYVGKTININDRFHAHMQDGKNGKSHKSNWIRKVLSEGGKVEIVYLDQTHPDGTLGSGDWTKLENFWGEYLKFLGFPIIFDGGWGNGGSKRKSTPEEVLKQQNLQAQVSGVKTYVYEIYTGLEYIFDSCSSAERFLNTKCVLKSKKSQLSKQISFVGSDFIISKGLKLSKKEIEAKVKESKQVKLKVAQLDFDNNLIKIYNSCREAVRAVGGTVAAVLDKKKPHKSAYGYKWVYLIDFITTNKNELSERLQKKLNETNFTKEEISYMRKNPDNLSVKSMCNKFHISHGTLDNIRYKRTKKYYE